MDFSAKEAADFDQRCRPRLIGKGTVDNLALTSREHSIWCGLTMKKTREKMVDERRSIAFHKAGRIAAYSHRLENNPRLENLFG